MKSKEFFKFYKTGINVIKSKENVYRWGQFEIEYSSETWKALKSIEANEFVVAFAFYRI